LIFKRILSILL